MVIPYLKLNELQIHNYKIVSVSSHHANMLLTVANFITQHQLYTCYVKDLPWRACRSSSCPVLVNHSEWRMCVLHMTCSAVQFIEVSCFIFCLLMGTYLRYRQDFVCLLSFILKTLQTSNSNWSTRNYDQIDGHNCKECSTVDSNNFASKVCRQIQFHAGRLPLASLLWNLTPLLMAMQ